ncbi:MAG: acyltransferase [Tannerella sp.]|jgi:acetyltransferase-like isoleucine patch superfamily enzyme|nr:acyltransferase [Tannerella sp.]
MSLIATIKSNDRLKKFFWRLCIHSTKDRPRQWFRLLLPIFIKRGKKSVIYRSVRKDIFPSHQFTLGNYSIVEDFATIANAMGDIHIGNRSRIGLGNTIIGPVNIGNNVNLAQNVVVSGLNHNYSDVNRTIKAQGVNTSLIVIRDDVWIGANSVVLAGVTIGKHVVVGAGSVVTRDIPDYSIALGNPARVIKVYDLDRKEWVKAY